MGKGFIQERLHRFCGSAEWIVRNDSAVVEHVLRQASDLAMIILDSRPKRAKTGAIFIFYAN